MHTIYSVPADGGPVLQVLTDDLPRLLRDPRTFLWVDVSGPLEPEDEALAREVFRFHPLALADCFEAREQPKVEAFDGYLNVITHGLLAGSTAEEAETIELDAFLGPNYLFTFHAAHSRSIARVRGQVERDGGPLRRGPSFLLHAVLDAQVDGIEEVIDGIEEQLDLLEGEVFTAPARFDLERLLAVKRTTIKLRRWMNRQREAILRVARQEFGPLVGPSDALLYRDVHDHLARFADQLENARESAISILDVYLALTNNRLNETMKFLTLFTAILMPLTVISGIYGMNFEFMPELHAKWGYPAALLAMATTALLVVRFFQKRGLLGNSAASLTPASSSDSRSLAASLPEPRSPAASPSSQLTKRRTTSRRRVV